MTAETLADASPPKVAQASVDLPTATVGSPYRAELPTFADPGGKGLRLTASGLPEGLTFSDLGGGKGAIEGVPEQATSASIRIVATNHHDRTAQMSATLVVADKPAPPPGPVAKLETPSPAPSQKPSHVPVSPNPQRRRSRRPRKSPRLRRLHRQFRPQRRPRPTKTRRRGSAFRATQQTVARVEAPPPQPPSLRPSEKAPPPVAPASAEEKAKAFIASFDGGECFLIEPLPGATKPARVPGGRPRRSNRSAASIQPTSARSASRRNLTVAPITAEQCPALDLVRLAPPDGRQPPRLALKSYEVGPGQPLSGTISNLEGRRLYLVLVDNDGLAHRLDAKVDASGDSATFSVPLTPDASSVGPMQMLLAIVSDKPIPTLDTLHSAKLEIDRVATD